MRGRRSGSGVRGRRFMVRFFLSLIVAMVVGAGVWMMREKEVKEGKLEFGPGVEARKVEGWLEGFNRKGVGDAKVVMEVQTELPANLPVNVVLAEVMVPVAKFNEVEKNEIGSDEAGVRFLPVELLRPYDRLLKMDGKYFLDDFRHGAKFGFLKFSGEGAEKFAMALKNRVPKFPTAETTLTVMQTGVTAPAREMGKILRSGKSGRWVAEKIAEELASADVTHISNEVSFGKNCPLSGMKLCAEWDFMEALSAIGTDVVELTGNHLQDFGEEAFLGTLAKYREMGWKTFGGGKDLSSAREPLRISMKGTSLTWIGVNQSTSLANATEKAGENHAGINPFDIGVVTQQIREAKANGDFVLVDVQFFECYAYPDHGEEMPECDKPIAGQKDFFQKLIELGADMVVGTQAHQPQTYEIYNEKPIFYGLGNLFFDQTAWPGTTRSLVLKHYFYNGRLMQARVMPTRYGADYQTVWMGEEEAGWFLKRLSPELR